MSAKNKETDTFLYTRKKKYIPEVVEWVREGFTKKDIAKKLDVSYKTLHTWINRYDEFKEAFNTGTDLLLDDIEASLYRNTRYQTMSEKWYDANGDIVKEFVKDIVPNQRAIEYALNNRRPEKWKSDTQSIDISLSEQMREKLSSLTLEDISALANLDVDNIDEDGNVIEENE